MLSFAWLQVIHMTAASISSQVYLQNYGACPRHRPLVDKPVHQDLHGVRSGAHEMRRWQHACLFFLSFMSFVSTCHVACHRHVVPTSLIKKCCSLLCSQFSLCFEDSFLCDGPESACMTAWLKSAQKNISEFKREQVVAMFPCLQSHAWFSLPDGKRGIRRELSVVF